ncbi:hypothetical protein B0H16DRAFT_1793571 [Mycena metata]|uniref:Uncharacterized protein n=1 Tax=Mycena metata TaxID=1033252 RepID=A0AAD7HI28_9AGAR|nr:hypothetical protein B0H16DRAFT_1793571 [Mycena metata]
MQFNSPPRAILLGKNQTNTLDSFLSSKSSKINKKEQIVPHANISDALPHSADTSIPPQWPVPNVCGVPLRAAASSIAANICAPSTYRSRARTTSTSPSAPNPAGGPTRPRPREQRLGNTPLSDLLVLVTSAPPPPTVSAVDNTIPGVHRAAPRSRRTSTAEHENISSNSHRPHTRRRRRICAQIRQAHTVLVSRAGDHRDVHRARMRLRLAPPHSPTVSTTKKELEKETPTTEKMTLKTRKTRLTYSTNTSSPRSPAPAPAPPSYAEPVLVIVDDTMTREISGGKGGGRAQCCGDTHDASRFAGAGIQRADAVQSGVHSLRSHRVPFPFHAKNHKQEKLALAPFFPLPTRAAPPIKCRVVLPAGRGRGVRVRGAGGGFEFAGALPFGAARSGGRFEGSKGKVGSANGKRKVMETRGRVARSEEEVRRVWYEDVRVYGAREGGKWEVDAQEG